MTDKSLNGLNIALDLVLGKISALKGILKAEDGELDLSTATKIESDIYYLEMEAETLRLRRRAWEKQIMFGERYSTK